MVVVLVIGWWLVGGRARELLGLPGERAAPEKARGSLRVATWNLHNFPGEKQDLQRLHARLEELTADLIAVQEVRDPAALRALMPGWELEVSQAGGRGGQRLGFLYDPSVFELVGAPREHPALAMGGRVRPGFSGYLRARASGRDAGREPVVDAGREPVVDFHLVVVHLKARPEGQGLRRSQWEALAEVVEELRKEDPDVMVVGDFNTTGAGTGGSEEELSELRRRLSGVGLSWVRSDLGCSSYWDGGRRDAWQEASLLDLVWVGGLEEVGAEGTTARSLLHCARHRCEAFRSTEGHPEPDYADLSDHCPVIVDLHRPRPAEEP